MAITSVTAVGAEYASRVVSIRAYKDSDLNTLLAGLDGLAAAIDEALELYQAREILNGQTVATDPASSPIWNAAASIRRASRDVRDAVNVVKANIPD